VTFFSVFAKDLLAERPQKRPSGALQLPRRSPNIRAWARPTAAGSKVFSPASL